MWQWTKTDNSYVKYYEKVKYFVLFFVLGKILFPYHVPKYKVAERVVVCAYTFFSLHFLKLCVCFFFYLQQIEDERG